MAESRIAMAESRISDCRGNCASCGGCVGGAVGAVDAVGAVGGAVGAVGAVDAVGAVGGAVGAVDGCPVSGETHGGYADGGTCGGCTDGGMCGGCTDGGTLYLTAGELDLLRRFGEIPFWPVCRAADREEPVSPDGMDAASLSSLALKGLIRLDYDLPLSNYVYDPSLPHQGSMALTAAGQAAVELLEIRGAEE